MKAPRDPDAWIAKPQPTPETCRLFHGVDCRRGCARPCECIETASFSFTCIQHSTLFGRGY